MRIYLMLCLVLSMPTVAAERTIDAQQAYALDYKAGMGAAVDYSRNPPPLGTTLNDQSDSWSRLHASNLMKELVTIYPTMLSKDRSVLYESIITAHEVLIAAQGSCEGGIREPKQNNEENHKACREFGVLLFAEAYERMAKVIRARS